MLKSALNLILEPLHLSYVIKDEVLKITSEQMRDGEVYTVTYNVADLVMPIPNFVPNGHMGLHAAPATRPMSDWATAAAAPGGVFDRRPAVVAVASDSGKPTSAMINPGVLAQMRTRHPAAARCGPASRSRVGSGRADWAAARRPTSTR